MQILAFVVLAALGLVVFLTFTKRHRDRDRWPYNLDKSSSTSDTSSTDPSWSPTASTLIAAGTLSVLNDDNATANALQSDETQQSNEAADTSSSWSEHGATGSWGESGDSASDSDSSGGDSDSGGGDGGGSSD